MDEEIEEVATDDDVLSRYRVSSSMPNVALSNHWFDDRPTEFGNRAVASASWDKLNLIPSGLPPLHTARKDGNFVLLFLLFHLIVQSLSFLEENATCFDFFFTFCIKSLWRSAVLICKITELGVGLLNEPSDLSLSSCSKSLFKIGSLKACSRFVCV